MGELSSEEAAILSSLSTALGDFFPVYSNPQRQQVDSVDEEQKPHEENRNRTVPGGPRPVPHKDFDRVDDYP